MNLTTFTQDVLKEFDEKYPLYPSHARDFLTTQLRLLAEGMKEIVPPEAVNKSFRDDYANELYQNGREDCRDETITNYNRFME